jgi:hypothetical protein
MLFRLCFAYQKVFGLASVWLGMNHRCKHYM